MGIDASMNRRPSSYVTLLQMVTLLPLLVCSLSGCNGSSTTLALDNPASTKPSVSEATELPIPAADLVSSDEHPEDRPETDSPTAAPLQTNVDPAQMVGRWQDSFFGKRTLVLNADGTAQMRLDLDFAGSLLYGKQVDFDMKWSLDQGTVTIDILKGKPESAAKSLMDTWGTQHIYLLDLVESERIEMRDKRHLASHTLQRLPE
ncbi:MAG: hypothetical protein JWP89_286 [Schlesneria sp.]|nr:hypothetical protein [Schlesneria sp.]